ncbi:hypothetical protein [Luedemannella helvata]|uniref:hypothetical protein n=1 Tax=Luedemannella helvata TaxID=349315 RepID=UPI0031E36758
MTIASTVSNAERSGVFSHWCEQRGRRYGDGVKVRRHWWNGGKTPRARRDVYIRSDGQRWDVLAQIGGPTGRCRVQECPSSSSALIVADAWRGSSDAWREMALP